LVKGQRIVTLGLASFLGRRPSVPGAAGLL
jgi:hypothetical protein